MTPLQNHIIINPHQTPESIGLFSLQKDPTNKATVLKVSKEVYGVGIGDTITYPKSAEKWQDGNCILNIDMVLAKF